MNTKNDILWRDGGVTVYWDRPRKQQSFEPMIFVPRECAEYWCYKKWPKFVRGFLCRHKVIEKNHMPDGHVAWSVQAVEICGFYMKSQPKENWPTFLGMSPAMDRAIGLLLKEEGK